MIRRLAILFLTAAAAFAQSTQALPDTRLDQMVAERKAILDEATPYWKSMCELVDAILIDNKRAAFLKNNRRLSERFSSVEQFSDAVDKWKPRAWALPADIRKVDWDRLSVQYLESRTGDSVVVVLKERDTDRFLRIKGIFAGSDLIDISLLAGNRVQAPVKSTAIGGRGYR